MKVWVPRFWGSVLERPVLAVLVLAAAGMLFAPAASRAAKPPSPDVHDAGQALSLKAAESFQRKLMELSRPVSVRESLKPIVVTDTEVNSYFKYDRLVVLPPGVRDLVFHIKPDGIHGAANVNFDKVKPSQQSANDFGTKILASIFTGDQRVTAVGKLVSSHGSALLTIQDVHVGTMTLSDWLVNWVLQTYVESQYHLDLSKPFLLPANVSRIEFAPGKAVFVRRREEKKP
ncbi:MAG TPA: hypothetical protein VMW54_09770 [Terriglobia bacterium]|nr:hypothetical protein [Terriglobia bacterium]